jgi:hypothetical protein
MWVEQTIAFLKAGYYSLDRLVEMIESNAVARLASGEQGCFIHEVRKISA